jgi:antitoxin ParD1/3/4
MTPYPPDIAEYVAQKITRGDFASPDEFAIAAARAYREIERRQDELRRELQLGIDQADQGLVAPLDVESIKRELAEKFEENGRLRRGS